jgi:hypothetical protein
MKRTLQGVFLVMFAAEALAIGQGPDVSRVLSQIRDALGGQKLDAVKTIALDGQASKPAPDGTSNEDEFQIAFELPDGSARFVKKDVLANFSGMVITRRSGFDGSRSIDELDAPPQLAGGLRVMRRPPAGAQPGADLTPEQQAAQQQEALQANRREFARLVLGLLGRSSSVYPLTFTYAGQMDAPNGKADVLDVVSPDGFSGKFFVDAASHMPLMLSWMANEPVRMVSGGMRVVQGGGGGAATAGAVDPARAQEEAAARLRQAEANPRTVEFRLVYGEYKSFDGVRLPTRIQRMVDGLTTEDLRIEHVKINGQLDSALFMVGK